MKQKQLIRDMTTHTPRDRPLGGVKQSPDGCSSAENQIFFLNVNPELASANTDQFEHLIQ